jgi:putative ABC transport system permease protein
VDELAQHLDDRYNELRLGGATEDAARREALTEFEDANLVRELTGIEPIAADPLAFGSGGTGGVFSGLWHDLRFGARILVKERAAAAVIVATLGLAIAANAMVFGLTDLLLLRPLPFRNADRLVAIYAVDHRQGNNRERLSIPDYLDVSAQASSFDSVAAITMRQVSLIGAGEPMAATAELATPNVSHVWGFDAVVGRTFQADDGRPGRSAVMMLSHRFWAARFGSDRSVIGRTLTVNGTSYTVIGVVTPAVELGNLDVIDLWLPLETSPTARRGDRAFTVFGLLKPGATLAGANAEVATIAERLQRSYPVSNAEWRMRAISLREATAGAQTWILLTLFGIIVGLVLLVACANVATVMQARASARRREIAVRLALGATAGRLVRQLVVEGVLVGLMGGAAGLALGYGGLVAFKAWSPESYFQRLEINTNLLLFTIALSLVAPVLFAAIPAVQSSRPDLNEDLKEGSRHGVSPVRGGRTRATLVVAQIAFALALLVVTALVVRSIVAIEHVPLGVDDAQVLTARVRFDPPKYMNDEARMRAATALLDRLRAVPGVTAAAMMAGLPVVDGEPIRQFLIEGQPPPPTSATPWAVEAAVAGDYQRVFGTPLEEGRAWTADDPAPSTPVAIVSREAARRYWPGRSPIGTRVRALGNDGAPTGDVIEIVGVAGDVKGRALAEPAPPRIYRPLAQRPADSVAFALRTRGEPLDIAPAVREALRAADRDLAIAPARTYTSLVDAERSFFVIVIGMFVSFGGIALLLALTGVYGVTAFATGERRHEIGVRVALGATPASVARLIVGSSFRLIAIGVCGGVPLGFAIATTMRRLLFGVSAADPTTYLLVIAAVTSAALAASYIPAHRAMSIDPIAVLKQE